MADSINLVLNVPHYAAMVDYRWVGDFIKAEGLKKSLADLKVELTAVRNAPVDNATFRERIKQAFEADRLERLQRIAVIIGGLRQHGNAFSRLSMRQDSHTVERAKEIFPLADILDAVDMIPEPAGALTEKQQVKALSNLEKKISDTVDKLSKVSPPEFFAMENGRVTKDLRVDFVHFWRQRQQKCNAPIGPTGITLADCPRSEQTAYRRLEIGKGVNKQGLDPSRNISNVRIAVWPDE